MACMVMNTLPSTSPTSKTLHTFGWSTRAWARASTMKRWRWCSFSRRTNLMATSRPSLRSRARNTMPMPPCPRKRVNS